MFIKKKDYNTLINRISSIERIANEYQSLIGDYEKRIHYLETENDKLKKQLTDILFDSQSDNKDKMEES